jgi:hypothetical protein
MTMNTFKSLRDYFNEKYPREVDLESKKEMKERFEADFEDLLSVEDNNPLFLFILLYHRLQEIANVAKDVFYEPAIEYLKENLDEDESLVKLLGTGAMLKTSVDYDIVKSPKILKLEKEIKILDEKNQKTIKAYEKYSLNRKSIAQQIKAEEKNMIEQGLATKKGEKNTISLSY